MDPITHSESTTLLTAQRGGLAPAAPVKMHPSEIALTLPAEILRLPYPPATRLVLAEIVSLYSSNAGCCDASDPHFAARLTINKDTVSVAVKLLEKEGLITKVVTPVQGGKYRTLTPNVAAIAAKAATNAYPDVPVNTRRKFRRVQDGNSGLHTPEFPDSHAGNSVLYTPEFPDSQTGISGGNTPVVNTPEILQVNPPTQAASAAGAGAKKNKEAKASGQPLPAELADSAPRCAPPPSKKPVLLRESSVATFPAFVQAWQAAAETNPDTYADYVRADLQHYHAALLDWSDANSKKKHDWLATIRSSMRNDHANGKLCTLNPSPHAHQSKQHRPAAGRYAAQATQSSSARQPISEGIQIGPPLTGTLDDL